MASLSSCPGCGRRAQKALSSNHFPVHTCQKCRHKYCNECGDSGPRCPRCGSTAYSDLDKVYS